MISIAISGPESSGKTMLAIALAQRYRCFYVPEYARYYLNQIDRKYTFQDLKAIFQGQINWFEAAAAAADGNALLIQDGDPAIQKVWETERFGRYQPDIDLYVRERGFDFVLLCRPDLPWTYDPLRESRHDRDRLFELYRKQLEAWQTPFAVVSGSGKARIESAVNAIEAYLKEKG